MSEMWRTQIGVIAGSHVPYFPGVVWDDWASKEAEWRKDYMREYMLEYRRNKRREAGMSEHSEKEISIQKVLTCIQNGINTNIGIRTETKLCKTYVYVILGELQKSGKIRACVSGNKNVYRVV